MPLITQISIQAVLDACDMVEIVSPYTTIKKSGANYMGRCPFHGEKTPSFSIDPARKLYYCFGCGEGGNAFRFLQQKEGLEFADAVKQLADKYGVRLEFEKSSPGAEKRRNEHERLLRVLDDAATYYSRVLAESHGAAAARSYLEKRGFTEATIKAFRLGFSPARGDSLLRAASAKEYGHSELIGAGLIQDGRRGKIDRFRGRLMFPFADHRGRILGFGARVLDDSKPKYLNSPETELYHKSKLVFGLGNARLAIAREDRAYIVEGYTDVLALNQSGIENSVASMGTALTEDQLREVARFTKNIYLAYDADAAGQAAMIRALELARKLNLDVRVVEIPGGKDPADLVSSETGARDFCQLGDAAPGLLQYHLQTALSRFDLDAAEGRIAAYKAVAPILAKADPVERAEQMRIVADRLRLSPENMAYLMESAALPENEQYGDQPARRVLSQDEITEKTFLSLCLAREKEAGRYLQLMTEAYFTTAANRAAFNWVKSKAVARPRPDAGTMPPSAAPTAVPTAIPLNGELSTILPELMIRAETESFADEALPELFMKLGEAEIGRRISSLREKLDSGVEVDLEELYRLEHGRREILRKIRSGTYESV